MQIPKEPTPNLVIVKNIDPKTTEKTLHEFFSFCGAIEEFELNKDKHEALILFERSSAARTAVLLSNATIDGSKITVEPYFETRTEKEEEEQEGRQEAKPKTNIMAELLAAGYTLTDHVLNAGVEFDHKYGVWERVQPYWDRILAHWRSLDQKYGVQEKTRQLTDTVENKAETWLKTTPAGQQVQYHVLDTIAAIHAEAKRIAANKSESRSST